MGRKFKNERAEIGKKYGKLTVLSFSHKKQRLSERYFVNYFLCRCDCGKEVLRDEYGIVTGRSSSCGCFRKTKTKPGESGFKEVIRSYRYNAKRRGFEYILTIEEVRSLLEGNCFYCDNPPSNVCTPSKTKIKDHHKYRYNGLDRVDSTKGYYKENVVSCCYTCNIMKNDLNIEEFYDHIKKIIKKIS